VVVVEVRVSQHTQVVPVGRMAQVEVRTFRRFVVIHPVSVMFICQEVAQ
jgi:hypothetical protein